MVLIRFWSGWKQALVLVQLRQSFAGTLLDSKPIGPGSRGIERTRAGSALAWDLLDHVIVLNERHLRRLMKEYVHYYHDDLTHGSHCGSVQDRFLHF